MEIKGFHILTALFLNIVLLVTVFSTDSPLMLTALFLFTLVIFASAGELHKLKKGFVFFLPFSMVTAAVNFLFVGEGKVVIFNAFGKVFTLEALIYALILSSKLLAVIYIFMLMNMMTDSDRAVSYFSSVMPKATLLFMVAFKLYPTMKDRLAALRQIYSLRGVSFEGSLREKLGSMMPMLAILLESSLEGAFDIGEASYVRGFLGGKRTVYDRQSFSRRDYLLAGNTILFFLTFIAVKLLKQDYFDIYSGITLERVLNPSIFIAAAVLLQLAASVLVISRVKGRA